MYIFQRECKYRKATNIHNVISTILIAEITTGTVTTIETCFAYSIPFRFAWDENQVVFLHLRLEGNLT